MQYQPDLPRKRGNADGRHCLEGVFRMRKLLSLVALCCAMALAFGGFAPRASAAQLPTGLLALKTDRVGAVQDVRYRCWWRDGYRRCGYVGHRGWRQHHRWNRGSWRHRHWRHRHWRHHRAWRSGYYGRRHYYYRSYARPSYGYAYRRPYAYCIGLCWW